MQQTGTYNSQLASITAPRFDPNAIDRGPAWPNGPPEVGLSDIPFLTVGRGGDNKWEILTWTGRVPSSSYVPKGDYPKVKTAKSEGWEALIRPNTHMPARFQKGGSFLAMRTTVISTWAIPIQINVKGDDGTALFVNGNFICGGGTQSEQNVGTIQFPTGTPVELCAIVSNSSGPMDIALQVPISAAAPPPTMPTTPQHRPRGGTRPLPIRLNHRTNRWVIVNLRSSMRMPNRIHLPSENEGGHPEAPPGASPRIGGEAGRAESGRPGFSMPPAGPGESLPELPMPQEREGNEK